MYSVVLLLLLLHMSHNNYYIMPSHTPCVCVSCMDLMNIHVQVFLHFIMHVTLIGLLQLPIMYLLLLMYSVLESQHMVAKLIIMAK